MPASKKPAREVKSKASRPEVHPLGEHLAELLNPALVEPKPQGLGEAPQARFESAAPDSHPHGLIGAPASAELLKALIEEGDPNIRNRPPWMPHRPPRPEKSEGGRRFRVVSEFEPEGDQPQAIEELVKGVRANERDQVLLGVTGSGKTFTMAKVIEATQRPALILAPNKTLAAQLYGEFKSFFPDNAVEYFVSYYDYYQPEAYVPRTDTYIEKESDINEQIDRMRHSATRALLERDDVIIVASVSCIYGIGSVETYTAMTFSLKLGDRVDQRQLIKDLVALQYKRSQAGDFSRGVFRVRGDTIEIFPAHYEDRAWRIGFFGDEIESIAEFDPLTGKKTQDLEFVKIYANSHYVTPRPTLLQSVKASSRNCTSASTNSKSGRLLEAQRLEQRCMFDLEMLEATGSCAGIENYSRYLTGGSPASRRRPCSNICRTMRSSSPTKSTSPCRRSAACIAATLGGRRPGGIWLPPAVVPRQPAFALRGMGGDAAANRPCFGDAGEMGDGANRRRIRRAGDPADRPDRSAGRDAPGARRRSTMCSARSSDGSEGLPLSRYRADEAHGGGLDGISPRERRARALHA